MRLLGDEAGPSAPQAGPTGAALPFLLPTGTAPAPPFDRQALVSSGLLVADFAPPDAPWLSGHRGVDLVGAAGSPVVSPAAGVVTFAGVVVDRPLVVVTHPDGLRSSLEPVVPTLAVGTAVGRGDAVGTLDEGARSHCAPASCLHWGVRRADVYLDPLTLVGVVEPVVLLPVRGSGPFAA